MLTIIGAMVELERNVIRERVVAGIEYARQHGTKSGNAIGRPKRIFDRDEVARLREAGLSIENIARQMKLGVGTVVRTLRAHETSTKGSSKTPAVASGLCDAVYICCDHKTSTLPCRAHTCLRFQAAEFIRSGGQDWWP